MDERIKALAKQAGCMTTIQIKIDKWSATDYSYLVNNELGHVSDDGKYYEFNNLENKFKMERYLRGEECDEVKRLRKDKAELLKMLNQMLDDMGATGHSVCGAVKAMGRYIIAKHQTDEEAFLDYTIHQAVKVLLEVDMISEEQAKTAIAKATGDE